MRSRRYFAVIVAVLAILFGANSSRGADASTQPSTTTASSYSVDELISKLSADDWQVRQNAQDKLVLLGDKARPKLDQLLRESKDLEARARAEAAIGLIEENRLIGPSIITIHMHDVPPEKVVAELGRQAYTDLKTMPEHLWGQKDWPNVSIDIEQKPFWPALREVCEKIGLRPQNMGGDRGLGL